jgi:RimJ/RimL family protein N-acetyltransferase
MSNAQSLTTPRLILRQWRDEDLAPFAQLNADPRVMEHFPSTLTKAKSDELAQKLAARITERGWGLWAVEVQDTTSFIGFVGLGKVLWQAHFTPCVEIGWRLGFDHWHRGYATEAARAAVDYAFDTLRLAEIVSFTVPANHRSRAVMERLGMTSNESDDFDHPELPAGHPIRRHVLYRLRNPSP